MILEEVEGTRPLAGGTGIELEVLYDGQAEEVQHVVSLCAF